MSNKSKWVYVGYMFTGGAMAPLYNIIRLDGHLWAEKVILTKSDNGELASIFEDELISIQGLVGTRLVIELAATDAENTEMCNSLVYEKLS